MTAATSTTAPTGSAGGTAEVRVDPEGWEAAVAGASGPQIVVGGPGTGKSEFLVRRVAHLVDVAGVAGNEILVVSFGRRGVADLDRRIQERLRPAPMTVNVATFHSVAANLVEAHATERGWAAAPEILTGPEQTALVRELLAAEDPADWPGPFRTLLTSGSFAAEVTDFLLRAAEQLLGPDDIAARRRDDWRGLPGLMRRYHDVLVERGRIDYGTLLAEAVGIVEAGLGGADRYAHVLADEFQDTTVGQARLLAALVEGEHHITAAADPYQSIYSFRGAAVENVARFGDTFGTPASPARRLVLTTSFRTPAAILTAAERVTSRDIPGAAGPVVPAGGGGRVDVHVFGQRTEEAEWIAAEILRLHLSEAMPFARMAVFVRSKRRLLAELSRALQRRGIPHDEPGSRQADQPAVRLLGDLALAASGADPVETDRAVRRILLGPCFALPLGKLRDLERARLTGPTWPEVLRSHLPGAEPLAALLEDGAWAGQKPAVEALWHVWSSLPQLAAIATDPGRAAERRSWASLSQVLGRWNERNPRSTIRDYHRLLAAEEFEAEPLLSHTAAHEDRVTITTLHQAKGMEFDTVFIADAVEGTFPDLRVRDSLLGVRHLLPGVPEDGAAYRRFRLQEERRLAYTAMTRAARRVVWTATATGFEEGNGVPSRFLALVAGTASVEEATTPPPPRSAPVTTVEAEAMLRRLAADPAVAGPRRAAALRVLAGGARWGLRPPSTFAGLRDRGPDRGLVGDALRLSPTAGELYEACPRRYALIRRLGIGDRPSPHAVLGSLVHAVSEAVEQAARERGDRHATLAEAEAELARRFPAPDGDPHALAWLERARESLRSLYGPGRWPGQGPAVGLERRLTITVDGAAWTGVADRIEDRGGALAVVDLKTSSSALTIAEAEDSLQLGFYVLGAAADAELAAQGTAGAAEMWYPYYSKAQQKVAVRRFDPARLDEVRERLVEITRAIRAERWEPRPSPDCDRCPVRPLCPAQPEGREGFVT